MPRDDSLTPRNLVEKLDVLVVACDKCGRSGRYRVLRLTEQIGWDGKLTDWLYNLTKDCPRKNSPRRIRPLRRAVPGLAEGGIAKAPATRGLVICRGRRPTFGVPIGR
jgi:hypothetical protein